MNKLKNYINDVPDPVWKRLTNWNKERLQFDYLLPIFTREAKKVGLEVIAHFRCRNDKGRTDLDIVLLKGKTICGVIELAHLAPHSWRGSERLNNPFNYTKDFTFKRGYVKTYIQMGGLQPITLRNWSIYHYPRSYELSEDQKQQLLGVVCYTVYLASLNPSAYSYQITTQEDSTGSHCSISIPNISSAEEFHKRPPWYKERI